MSLENEQALATLVKAIAYQSTTSLILFEPVQCLVVHEGCTTMLQASRYWQQDEIAASQVVEVVDPNAEEWKSDLFVDALYLNSDCSDRIMVWLANHLDQLR